MRFVAGIDGGGTSTRVECRDEQGGVLCRRTFGPFNINSTGEARFSALLTEITDFLAGMGTCIAVCIGAAGISNPRVQDLTAQAMEGAGIARWRLVGDHEIALYGALSGEPGCVLIAGTGSICCGKNAKGEFARAGGWGHLIDDGGSGYALGRDAAAAVVRQWDGRGEDTLLTELIAGELGLRSPQALTAWIYAGDKSRLAGLAPLVGRAASAGDRTALRIYRENGEELARLVCAVTARLGLMACDVALLGGLLEHDTYLRTSLIRCLAEKAPELRCVSPRQDALAGAALLAAELI
ncbi:MAG: ATPase [Oscillibacter sp.]|nr:ATPase [Oscillibacter sp.]